MSLVLIPGAARANSIGAGISTRLTSDGWQVVTSDLVDADVLCDLASPAGPEELGATVNRENGPISARPEPCP